MSLFINTPSVYAHIISSIIILISIIVFYYKFSVISNDAFIVILLLFAIVIALHGISHLGLEKAYNFNPLK